MTTSANSNTDTGQPKSESPLSTTKQFISRWLVAGGLVISCATLLRLLALRWWLADLFCQFSVQYVILLFPIVTLLLLLGKRKTALAFALILFVNGFVIWPYVPAAFGMNNLMGNRVVSDSAANDRANDAINGTRFRLLTQNVLTSNQDYPALIKLIQKERPDFVILIEIDQRWIDGMQEIHVGYPHRKMVVHPGNFGIGIYSKIPWTECRTHECGPNDLPTIFAYFETEGRKFQIVGTHPLPPIGSTQSNSRNQQLLEVVEQMDLANPRILTGDFNLTPWSPWFKEVLDRGVLRDPATDFNIDATWFTFPTILGGVKIDHALVAEMSILDHRVGPHVNSDHRAVIIDFVVE